MIVNLSYCWKLTFISSLQFNLTSPHFPYNILKSAFWKYLQYFAEINHFRMISWHFKKSHEFAPPTPYCSETDFISPQYQIWIPDKSCYLLEYVFFRWWVVLAFSSPGHSRISFSLCLGRRESCRESESLYYDKSYQEHQKLHWRVLKNLLSFR